MAKQKPHTPKNPKSSGDSSPDIGGAKKRLAALQASIGSDLDEFAEVAKEIARADPRAFKKLMEGLPSGIRKPKKKATKKKSATQASETSESGLPAETRAAIFRELANALQNTVARTRTKVAFLGPLHSYSHLATLEGFGASADLVPVRTIAAVFEEVSSGQVQAGVVPIENSTDGRIVDTLERLTRASVKICGEIPLPIHHNLLGIGKRSDVVEVCSKPQAISQCRGWLSEHLPDAKITAMSSTTAAAERAAKDSKVAAIASRQAGVEYGLKVLAKNIEDNKDNVTRFAVIGSDVAEKTGDDKTSLMFELAHQPGALADAMMIFKRKGLNLTWIESFPKPGSPNEYLFFVELLGHQSDLKIRKAVDLLGKKTVRLELLGSYAQRTFS